MQTKSLSRISMVVAPMMIACAALIAGSPARAQSNDMQSDDGRSKDRDCSNGTLRGDYGSSSEGVLLNVPGLPPEAQFRGLTVTHLNGKGGLTWVEHTVINGTPIGAEWTDASGTYSVNPNCTGTAVVKTPNSPVPLNLAFVVVNQGKEVHAVLNSDAISTVFIKVK
jgi:hypothetical protein